MRILAIDPGTTESAYVSWCDNKLAAAEVLPNEAMLNYLTCATPLWEVMAIEMVASYGMAVGKEVFETCVWIGRFFERCTPDPSLIYRREVKLHHCGSPRAKDANVRQALIDKYGAPGTKRNPGLTYGLKSHLWQAFAIATYVSETSK